MARILCGSPETIHVQCSAGARPPRPPPVNGAPFGVGWGGVGRQLRSFCLEVTRGCEVRDLLTCTRGKPGSNGVLEYPTLPYQGAVESHSLFSYDDPYSPMLGAGLIQTIFDDWALLGRPPSIIDFGCGRCTVIEMS